MTSTSQTAPASQAAEADRGQQRGTASCTGGRRSDRPRGGSVPALRASRPCRHGLPRCYNRPRMPRAMSETRSPRRRAGPLRGKWPPDPARVRSILEGLEELYPDVDCELDRETPFQLLCATILSAQCTDERVNKVTPELFRRYPTPEAMARAPLPALEKIIRSTGFFRQKAKSLKGTAAGLLDRFGGEMPQDHRRADHAAGRRAQDRQRRAGHRLRDRRGRRRRHARPAPGDAARADPQDRPQGDRAGPDEGASRRTAGSAPATS